MKKRRSSDSTPRVFISSTVEDLRPYREAAKEAALGAQVLPVMMEYFTASGDRPPLQKCLQEVASCDLLVVIVGHRYGWVPDDPVNDEKKSVTWLEVEQAEGEKKEVLAFVVDDKHPWPAEQREENDLLQAIREEKADLALLNEAQQNIGRLNDFKEWLNNTGIRATFTDPENLQRLVGDALREWKERHRPLPKGVPKATLPADPKPYLRWLNAQCSHIDIRGLQVGKGRAYRFPIEELFMTLTTTVLPSQSKSSRTTFPTGEKTADRGMAQKTTIPLHEAMRGDRLIVVGDPGSGKTTFLRRVSHAFCQTRLGETPDAAEARVGVSDRTFPLFVRLNELIGHIRRCRGQENSPSTDHSPAWLPHFLAAQSAERGWSLELSYFRERLEEGLCTVMFDGLDEAPDRPTRETLVRLIEEATKAFGNCRFVVTSRPSAYSGQSILPEFAYAEIDPLSDDATETFLFRWSDALYPDDIDTAAAHRQELTEALHARPEIRRMARNPVMLTALAVVHWNEKRLPEQRADLYESIIRWLSRSREQKPGREKAERAVQILQQLALAMQDDKEGLRTQVPRRWAAEEIANFWHADERSASEAIELADSFLAAEELDSGIVVARGNDVQFWHRTFQEFLAAKAIASQTDEGQKKLLWGPPERLYLPEWREVILLFAGILFQHGPPKVDELSKTMIDGVWPEADLAAQARCAGLLGAIVRDLAPVDYEITDQRYEGLLEKVMAIFDRKRSQSVGIDTRIEAADALGQAGDERIDPHNDDYWVEIPPGSFWMGAQTEDPKSRNYDNEAYGDESPVHLVKLERFFLARYPVTVGQYRQFMDLGGYEDKRWWGAGGFYRDFREPDNWDSQSSFPTRPVTGVSWYEASAFTAWLNSRLTDFECRLPTEAEWERAARGVKARRYAWGNKPADETRLNFEHNIGSRTPVGIYPLGNTPDGICDMSGNVDEWNANWESEYKVTQVANPPRPKRGSGRVVRGGAWDNDAQGCRAAYRDGYGPHKRYDVLGFRLAAVHVKQDRGGEPEGRR